MDWKRKTKHKQLYWGLLFKTTFLTVTNSLPFNGGGGGLVGAVVYTWDGQAEPYWFSVCTQTAASERGGGGVYWRQWGGVLGGCGGEGG